MMGSHEADAAVSMDAEDTVHPFESCVHEEIRNLGLTGESPKPIVVTFEDVTAAAYRIKSGIKRTACEYSDQVSDLLGMQVYFKKEFTQVSGSYKVRGARNALLMLTKKQKSIGVIAASAGNHALGLAVNGKNLGIPVTVVMPINAPIVKVNACRKYGAEVFQIGADIIESKEHAMRLSKTKGYAYINGYDHPHIIAGQGTVGLEIVEQVENIDACVVPVGGGGLISGIAVALKSFNPNIEIIGVQSEMCPSLKAAFNNNGPIQVIANQALTLADGLCVAKVGYNAFATLRQFPCKVVNVQESFIAQAVLRLVELEKCVVEGAGAAGIAAVLAGLLPELAGKRVVFPLCGGNIDSSILGRVIERGLAADGRLIRFSVLVMDRPGGVAELTKLLASVGVSIKDILHERAWLKTSVYMVEIRCVVEARDHEHGCQLKQALEQRYGEVAWGSSSVHDVVDYSV